MTIVFEGLSLNETEQYECVYLLPDNTWATDGCYLSSLTTDHVDCACNHLTQFSIRQFVSGADVDTNIAATYDIEAFLSLDFEGSRAPIICLIVIYGLYGLLLLIFIR